MGLFRFNWNKEGPGVPKDAPRKKGAARFFEIVARDYSQLWLSGLILFVCAVPMIVSVVFGVLSWPYLGLVGIAALVFLASNVLVGPALAAMHTLIVKQLCDEPCFFWHAYKKAWKSCWKQAALISMLFSAICGMECVAAVLHLFSGGTTSPILLGMIMLGLYIASVSWLYSLLQLSQMDIKTGPLLKNSLLLTMGFLKRSLPAGLIVLAVGAVMILFFPPTLLLAFLGIPAFAALIVDMWAWPVMEQVFHISDLRAERREKERAEEEAAQA